MCQKNIIIVIGVIILGLIFCKYIFAQKNEDLLNCKTKLDIDFPKLRSSFKEKFYIIFTNELILEKLSNEPPLKSGVGVYPNRLVNLTDITTIGLEYYRENPSTEREHMLYTYIEPEFDKILNDF